MLGLIRDSLWLYMSSKSCANQNVECFHNYNGNDGLAEDKLTRQTVLSASFLGEYSWCRRQVRDKKKEQAPVATEAALFGAEGACLCSSDSQGFVNVVRQLN